jgi:adenylate kinase family enzyme
VEHYSRQGRLHSINGERPVEEIASVIFAIIEGRAAAA